MRTTRIRRLSLAVAIGAVAALLPLGINHASAAVSIFDFPCASGGNAAGDFNNDGRLDLAVGAPGDDLEQTEIDGSITKGVVDAGSINVTYSDASGLSPEFDPTGTPGPSSTRKYFSQNTPGILDNSEKDDQYGFSLAAGNFDGLGGDDLAIGVPGENGGEGAVHILYSGPANTMTVTPADTIGLSAGVPGTSTYNKLFTQDTPNVEGTAEAGDLFGYSVASADINLDGIDDLVIGAPREDLTAKKDAGVVQVIYGSPHGLDATGPSGTGRHEDQVFEQGPGQAKTPEVGRSESGDLFGSSLAIGQLNDGGGLDVAVGSPGEDIGSVPDAGAVRVLYSRGTTGLSTIESDFFHENSTNIDGLAQSGDRFGCSVAAGDFDGDHEDDLAVGVPGKQVGADKSAGAVAVIYNSGRTTGITADPKTVAPAGGFWTEDQVWTEDDGGIPGVSKPNDRMGATLAVANFDGAGSPEDLAIGLPTELIYTNAGAGSVRVIYGFASFGLTDGSGTTTTADSPAAFAQSSSDITAGCPLYGIIDDLPQPLRDGLGPCFLLGPTDYSPLLGIEEEKDYFGASIAAADFDGNGNADLVIGAPGEDLGLFVNWLTEEEATVPDDVLVNLGIPVPLSVDEAVDAGSLNIVYGPFKPPTDSTVKQDLLYRTGNSPLNFLRSILHSIPLLQDNRIVVEPADKSSSAVLTGDAFGTSQS